MRWESSDHRRYVSSRRHVPSLPIPGRIILGSLAIAAIILAFISNPPQLPTDLTKASPEVKPTAVAAAIVPIPTVAVAPSPTAAPSVAPTSTAAGPGGTRVHVVEQGDTLSKIAQKYYGDSSKWSKIMDANKDILKSPNSVQVGQKLKIPD